LCISVDCPHRAGRPMFWNMLCSVLKNQNLWWGLLDR